mmetsp:Transcript_37132/g.103691  ORF Transcript_37132/g.103691 Transcript_37132/m.103691 type:complete len:213 (+) Transcript_37132:491-1129(+)
MPGRSDAGRRSASALSNNRGVLGRRTADAKRQASKSRSAARSCVAAASSSSGSESSDTAEAQQRRRATRSTRPSERATARRETSAAKASSVALKRFAEKSSSTAESSSARLPAAASWSAARGLWCSEAGPLASAAPMTSCKEKGGNAQRTAATSAPRLSASKEVSPEVHASHAPARFPGSGTASEATNMPKRASRTAKCNAPSSPACANCAT